ncbi:MAG: DUF72 domain-containing protein [Myxococcales bacterium]
MELFVGTSGFSYAEWKGSFYPAGLPDAEMLKSYAERLATVEINNTFYRMPQPALLEGWSNKVTAIERFRFALKAPKSITHIARLKDAADGTAHFLKIAATLGPRLGPILFQLPPFFRKDAGVLREFLELLPPETQAAFEFRHPSWFDDEITTLLADKGAALVAGDPDEGEPLPLIATTRFGYLRLRAASYDLAGLEAWHARIAAQRWQEAYVYLKHEVLGPAYAQGLQQLFRGETPVLPVATPAQAAPPKQRKAAKKVAVEAKKAAKKTATKMAKAPKPSKS